MIYFCSQKNRRTLVLQSQGLNGIDYLEVIGSSPCGKELAVTLLKDVRSLALTPDNFTVTGGTPIRVVSVAPGGNDSPSSSIDSITICATSRMFPSASSRVFPHVDAPFCSKSGM